MSMKPSDFTVAVRQFVSIYPEITHEQARYLLEELDIEVVAKPGRISANASAIQEYEVGTLADVKAALEAIGIDLSEHTRMASRVFKEFQIRDAYAKEANQFNVSKSNFKRGQAGSSDDLPELPVAIVNKLNALKSGETGETLEVEEVANEPKVTKKRRKSAPKVSVSVEKKRRKSAPKVSVDTFDSITKMLELVKQHGGVKGALERVAELQAEIAEIESAVRVAEAAVKAA